MTIPPLNTLIIAAKSDASTPSGHTCDIYIYIYIYRESDSNSDNERHQDDNNDNNNNNNSYMYVYIYTYLGGEHQTGQECYLSQHR